MLNSRLFYLFASFIFLLSPHSYALDNDLLEANLLIHKQSKREREYSDFLKQDLSYVVKAANENPLEFRANPFKYEKLLEHYFNNYIEIDLEKLDLLPNINEIDFSQPKLSDFDMHCLYYLAKEKPTDIIPIVPYLKEKADDDHCLFILGQIYENNIEGRNDDGYKVEVEELIKILEKRCNKSQNLLYTLSLLNMKNDPEQAYDLMEKAANLNHANAKMILGEMNESGLGTNIDDEKAVDWYTKAADQGHAYANWKLARLYRYGDIVVQDHKKAVELFTKAANLGVPDAQYQLGFMYQKGEFVTRDLEKAIYWHTKAANQDYLLSLQALSSIYDITFSHENKEKALYCFIKGQEFNDRFSSIVSSNVSGLKMLKSKPIAETKRRDLDLSIDELLAVSCFFVAAPANPELKYGDAVEEEKYLGLAMIKKLFLRITDQLMMMKMITKQVFNPDFMNPYLAKPADIVKHYFNEDRAEKWVGIYPIGANRFFSFGTKENDLSASFMKIRSDDYIEDFLEGDSDLINEKLPILVDENVSISETDKEPVNQSFSAEYKRIKTQFINLVMETANLRNPLYKPTD